MSDPRHVLADGNAPHRPGSLAEMGALIGDPVRAAILHHLSDGSRRPAGELARLAGASPQAASAHLARLIGGGLLAVERQGRHRYFRIASGDTAEVIEVLANWVGPNSRMPPHPPELRRARLCYDHVAGRLGVAVCDALVECGLLTLGPDGPNLSEAGRRWCGRCGLHIAPRMRRPTVRLCLDWTERRHHLGGAFGAELARAMVARGHVTPGPRPRTLRVTAAGEAFLKRELGIALPLDPREHGPPSAVDDDPPPAGRPHDRLQASEPGPPRTEP